jgi:hypothetical protein
MAETEGRLHLNSKAEMCGGMLGWQKIEMPYNNEYLYIQFLG